MKFPFIYSFLALLLQQSAVGHRHSRSTGRSSGGFGDGNVYSSVPSAITTAAAPAVSASEAVLDSNTTVTRPDLSPLASVSHGGRAQFDGLPSSARLLAERQLDRLDAEDTVDVAIAAGRPSASVRNDTRYLHVLEAPLGRLRSNPGN